MTMNASAEMNQPEPISDWLKIMTNDTKPFKGATDDFRMIH